MKKFTPIILIFIACLGILLLAQYMPVIFQEGNPYPYFKGIIQLGLDNQKIVRLDVDEERYLSRSSGGKDNIVRLLEDEGYKFYDQMGSGYFFQRGDGFNEERLIVLHEHYSRFYSIWALIETDNWRGEIKWIEYQNEEYGFSIKYPSESIHNYFWTGFPESLAVDDLILPNQILQNKNNFYLAQKYNFTVDWQNGLINKTENIYLPEWNGQLGYSTPWHIVVFDVADETELNNSIKQRLGSGCNYKTKIPTKFENNYRVEIVGDGKDLGETACPVNYANYIIYNPVKQKVAFWGMGQECNIGFGFDKCLDLGIAESFRFE